MVYIRIDTVLVLSVAWLPLYCLCRRFYSDIIVFLLRVLCTDNCAVISGLPIVLCTPDWHIAAPPVFHDGLILTLKPVHSRKTHVPWPATSPLVARCPVVLAERS